MANTSYGWKCIPLLFLIHFAIEGLVVYNVASKFPEFTQIGFPTNFDQAKVFAETFRAYLETHYFDLLLFQFSSFLFLQTWCIPGTFLFNLLGGALFGIKVGFPLCVICNTLGALFAFLISKFFLKDIIMNRFPNQVNMLKDKVQEHKKDLFFYLVSTRLFPGSPNWAMNLTFPHLSIPIPHFVGSVAIGLMPWNFLTCEAGQVLSTFKSRDEIVKPSTYFTLIGLATLFMLPPVIRKISNMRERSKAKTEKAK